MLYFTLPYLHEYDKKLSHILFKLSIEEENKFITPVHFFSKYINLPYCYLSGGFNTNQGTFYKYHELEDNANCKMGGVKRLNLSNINFNELDLGDEYLNLVLKIYNTGSNFIDIYDDKIAKKILNKGYIYDFVLKIIDSDIEINKINNLINLDTIKLISLPIVITDKLDFLQQIKNRNKIELTVNSVCHNCCGLNHNLCLSEEHKLLYNYSNYSYINDCVNKDKYSNSNILSINEIIDKYESIGLRFFRLDDFPIYYDIHDFLIFFVNYFILEDYRFDVLNKIEMELYDD